MASTYLRNRNQAGARTDIVFKSVLAVLSAAIWVVWVFTDDRIWARHRYLTILTCLGTAVFRIASLIEYFIDPQDDSKTKSVFIAL